MRKLIVLRTIILFVLLAAVIMVGCQQQPEPAPAPPAPAPTLPPPPAPTPKPTPTPAPPPPTPAPDEPKLSANEVCSYVWSQLPSELPDGYEKSQFFAFTKQATYEGKGEWTFVIFGSMEEIGPLQTKIYEKTKDGGKTIWHCLQPAPCQLTFGRGGRAESKTRSSFRVSRSCASAAQHSTAATASSSAARSRSRTS